jgi:hypothetical protein
MNYTQYLSRLTDAEDKQDHIDACLRTAYTSFQFAAETSKNPDEPLGDFTYCINTVLSAYEDYFDLEGSSDVLRDLVQSQLNTGKVHTQVQEHFTKKYSDWLHKTLG